MSYLLDLIQWFLIFGLLMSSVGFFVGETGLPFIGHVGFFAIGAYASAIASTRYQMGPVTGALCGLLVTAVVAGLVCLLLLRLHGQLLLIASLGFCEIIRAIAECSKFTNGGTGLTVASSGTGAGYWILIFSLILLAGQMLAYRFIYRSRFGKLLHCLREDAELFQAGGRNSYFYTSAMLLFTALTASLAGTLFAHYAHYVDPTSFTIFQALQILLALMMGGLGSLRGNLAAAAILVVVPGLLRLVNVPVVIAGAINQIFFALLVIVLMRRFPRGIFGTYLLP